MAYFNAANVSSTAYPFLTIGAANLIKSFASEALREQYLPAMLDGRFSGTMALTEPGQGSALGDLKTMARPVDDGSYRLFGNKMYISGGDHEMTDNIVHMVLARLEGAPAGVRESRCFWCPNTCLMVTVVSAHGTMWRSPACSIKWAIATPHQPYSISVSAMARLVIW